MDDERLDKRCKRQPTTAAGRAATVGVSGELRGAAVVLAGLPGVGFSTGCEGAEGQAAGELVGAPEWCAHTQNGWVCV